MLRVFRGSPPTPSLLHSQLLTLNSKLRNYDIICGMGMAKEKDKTKKAKAGKYVLVGTYRGNQLTRWSGWYNYPISDKELTRVENINEGI